MYMVMYMSISEMILSRDAESAVSDLCSGLVDRHALARQASTCVRFTDSPQVPAVCRPGMPRDCESRKEPIGKGPADQTA